MPELANPKRERFCQEYVVDLNAKQAAIRAGYSERTAQSQGQRLLTFVEVDGRVRELKEERAERTRVTADKVVRELARLAFTDMRSFVKWGPDGVTLLDSDDLSEDDSAAVTEVSESFTENGRTLKFKLGHKDSALRQLAQHVGVAEKGGVNVNVNIDNRPKRDLAEMTEEELAFYERMLAPSIEGG